MLVRWAPIDARYLNRAANDIDHHDEDDRPCNDLDFGVHDDHEQVRVRDDHDHEVREPENDHEVGSVVLHGRPDDRRELADIVLHRGRLLPDDRLRWLVRRRSSLSGADPR